MAGADDSVMISDTPPRRVRDFGDLVRLAGSVLASVAVMLIAVFLRGLASGVERDVHSASAWVSWLGDLPTLMISQLATFLVVFSVLIQIAMAREWRQAVSSMVALVAGYAVVGLASRAIVAVGPQSLVNGLWSVTSDGGFLLPDVYAGMAAFLTAAGPHRLRSTVRWGWNIICGVAVVLVVMSTNSLSGVLLSFAIGRTAGLCIRLAAGTQNKGAWGSAIVEALGSVGIHVRTLARRGDESGDPNALATSLADDLVESSRIYDVRDESGKNYMVSVLDAQAHTSGYLAQTWQWIKLAAVSVRSDRTVREAVQHHQAMLLALDRIGLPAMRPYAVAEQAESAMLVLEVSPTLKPLNALTGAPDKSNGLDDALMEGYLRYLDAANRRGVTHRNITPACLALTGEGEPVIAGWQTGDSASTPANVSIDRVQALALFAALAGADRTIAAARRVWDDGALVDLVPFVQPVAVPRATRSLPDWSKRTLDDLRDGLRALAPEDVADSLPQVTLSRFSIKSVIATALLVVALMVIVTQLNMEQVIQAVRGANLWMAALSFAFGCFTWVASGVTLGVFIDRERRDPVGIFMSQAASSFVSVSMPAGMGPAFVNLQYLRRLGYKGPLATAIMTAVAALQVIVTFLLIVGIALFTGRSTFSGMVPTNTLVIVIAAVTIALGCAMAIPQVRRLVKDRLVPLAAAYARQLLDLLTRPKQLVVGLIASTVQCMCFGLAFWAALMAFGWESNVFETCFVFLLANTLGSAVPTPGGLGAVEAALMAGFAATGVPSAVALSATLVYRLATYWLRIPLGALAMQWLSKRNLV
ncbi:lysylphosphatidylglycerol synthase transmembrane domain-containing protein [Bifidobacterium vespertilionis]|uniref:Flippase-like domain-containing protein n=1 Tax=Bifidobacterium vespertilionis TaxID=2562524 RepID=A0A5J5E5Q1_9BIFI|nr:YbhN family protein [Bifidobacterium vespertilionis]KAA8822111.1 flippase-like domain-containing protein [Bifidobacterium vespertilionis]KAA8824526.1 flippase-like domain-containing protein [Bifidobacterium vespertilionis]